MTEYKDSPNYRLKQYRKVRTWETIADRGKEKRQKNAEKEMRQRKEYTETKLESQYQILKQ